MTDDNKKAFSEATAVLAVALREKHQPDMLLLRTYFAALQDLPIEYVLAAADHLMRFAVFFPRPSEWRAAAVLLGQERLTAQANFLRSLPAPLCETCSDTGWQIVDDKARKCDCAEQRRLERLQGRVEPLALQE